MKKIIILLALLMIASPVFAVTVSKVNDYKVLINGRYPLDFRYAKTFFYSPVSNRAIFVFSTGEKTSVPCSEQEYRQLILKLQPLVNQYQIDLANGKIQGTYLYEEMKRQRAAKKAQPKMQPQAQPQEQEQVAQPNEQTQATQPVNEIQAGNYSYSTTQSQNIPQQQVQSEESGVDSFCNKVDKATNATNSVLNIINRFTGY